MAFVRHNECLTNVSNVLNSDLGVIPKIGQIAHGTFILGIWGRSDIKQTNKQFYIGIRKYKKPI